MAKTATKKSAGKSGAGSAKKGSSSKGSSKYSGTKSAAKKTTVKKTSASKNGAAKKSPRTPNAAFMRPMEIGEALHPIVGSKSIPRTQVVKKVWEYIKKHDLQDKVNRRQINADDNMKKVFGGKKSVSMFEMTKLVNNHLT